MFLERQVVGKKQLAFFVVWLSLAFEVITPYAKIHEE